MANKYQKGLDFLANRGVNVLSTRKSLFGFKAECEYPYGQEKVALLNFVGIRGDGHENPSE